MAQYKTLNNFANEFSSSTSYAVGDLVMYLGELYKCTTAHNGAWNSADFSKTSVATQLANAGKEFGFIEYELYDPLNTLTAEQVAILETYQTDTIIHLHQGNEVVEMLCSLKQIEGTETTYFFKHSDSDNTGTDQTTYSFVIENHVNTSVDSIIEGFTTTNLYVHKIVINGALDADDNPADIGFYVVSLRATTIQLPTELTIDEWERFCKEVALLFSTAHNTFFFAIYSNANHTSPSKLDTYMYYDFSGIHLIIKDYQGGETNYLAGPQDATFTEQIITLSQYENELSALELDL